MKIAPTIVLILLPGVLLAQEVPENIDSVEPYSGKLHIQIPLAALPQGPAGSGFDLDLVYDSDQFELVPQMNTPPPGSLLSPVPGYQLVPGYLGGWAYNVDGYRLEGEQREDAEAPYGLLNCPGNPSDHARFMRFRVGLPDGSTHLLYLRGYAATPHNNIDAGNGFIGLNLAGQPSNCSVLAGWEGITGTRTFFTADGSYLKVEVDGNGDVWRLYFPDGRRILHQSNGDLEIKDANGNTVTVHRGCIDLDCDFPYTTITDGTLVDGLPRRIRINYGEGGEFVTRRDTITFPGPQGTQTTSVYWEVKNLQLPQGILGRPYKWSTAEWQGGATRLFTDPILTVKAVELPLHETTPGDPIPEWNSYAMGYSLATGFGELSDLRTPSGAAYHYDYAFDTIQAETFDGWYNRVVKRTLTKEAVSGNDSTETLIWTYSPDFLSSPSKTTTENPDGSQITHWFGPPSSFQGSPLSFVRGLTYRIDEPLGVVRKRVWAENKVPPLAAVGNFRATQNPYVQKETVTNGDGATLTAEETTIAEFMIDKNGNPTEERHYGWADYDHTDPESITGVPLLRTVITSYKVVMPNATTAGDDGTCSTLSQADTSYRCGYWMPQSATPWLTDKPRRLDAASRRVVSVDGASIAAISEFAYDDSFGKGNVTLERRWDSKLAPTAPSGALSASNSQLWERTYYSNGNVEHIYEPEIAGGLRPHASVHYESTNNYPDKVEYFWGAASTQKRTWTYEWDIASGTLKSKKDLDNDVKTKFTYDVVGRPKIVTEGVKDTRPNGLRKTETVYDDQTLTVTVKRGLIAVDDEKLQTVTQYDRLGRPVLVTTSDPISTSGIKIKTIYRTAQNETVLSTPYRETTDATMEWSCTGTDFLQRVTLTAMFKGTTAPSSCANTNTTGRTSMTYAGKTVTVLDPDDKKRNETRDALGRLTEVVEAPGVTNFGFSTTYDYDTLDNLRHVYQGGQTRTFFYTSLGRLDYADNPESGRIDYTYWPSGDLKTRKDDREAEVSFFYDGLHRITGKTYNDPLTPNVSYEYHPTAAPNIGQLKKVSSSAASTEYLEYDDLGRVTKSRHQVDGVSPVEFEYGYHLNDALASQKYPSGRQLTYELDIHPVNGSSAGRLGKVSGLYQGVTTPYADVTATAPQGTAVPRYTPDGRIAQMKLGNGVWETWDYRTPGTTTVLKVGTQASNDRMQLEYDFHATRNNGNLVGQTIRRSGQSWAQSYTYDPLNRLSTAEETASGAGSGWSRGYGYDRFGNRWVSSSLGMQWIDIHEPTVSTNFSSSTNRLGQASNYDEVGNQKYFAPFAIKYDVENRMIEAKDTPTHMSTYAYDGDGRRVKKHVISNSTVSSTTYYIFNALGQLTVEYSTQAPTPGTTYNHSDMLGSTRLVTNQGGATVECYDYLPFGRMFSGRSADGTVSGVNGRDLSCYPPNPDGALNSNLPQKFTGKERDAETRLDFFGARYYSAAQGRFTAADSMSGALENPQSWNKYAYTFNNPLRYVDPDGKWPTAIHHGMLAGAFGGLTPAQVDLLNRGSDQVDYSLLGQTLPSYGYQHGMRAPDETPGQARARTDGFIAEHLENASLAAQWLGAMDGSIVVEGRALREFGMAMHPVMDRTSPEHAGEQVFQGVPSKLSNLGSLAGVLSEVAGILGHSEGESKISRSAYRKTVDDIRGQYLKTFGKKAFKKATGCEDVARCAYDYSKIKEELWED